MSFPQLLRGLSILIFLFFTSSLSAQEEEAVKAVEILQSNRVVVRDTAGVQLRIFIGEVIFKHEEALLYCDSAVLNKETQSLDAFGNVVVEEGDSIRLEGDTLKYRSDLRKAEIWGGVYLTDKRVDLYTNRLFYETKRRYAYYLSGARIIDSTTIIESERGYFDARTDDVTFKDSVVILDPEYNVYSDTLRHIYEQFE